MKRFISIFFAHKVLFARKNFFRYIPFERNTAFVLQGSPVKSHARYFCTCVEKRNKQAKDKQLSLATIVWSKVQFIPCCALFFIFRQGL